MLYTWVRKIETVSARQCGVHITAAFPHTSSAERDSALGLANIVTVYVMFAMGPGDALLVLSGRVFLGAMFSGQMMTLIYSSAGGLLSWCVLCLLRKLLTQEQIWLASPAAAVFHNLGQLLAAAAVMRTWAVMAYLPYLVIAAVLAGLFTGIAAQALLRRLSRIQK